MAQPLLKDRARDLLHTSSQLWSMVQYAQQHDAPLLAHLAQDMQQLIAVEEATVTDTTATTNTNTHTTAAVGTTHSTTHSHASHTTPGRHAQSAATAGSASKPSGATAKATDSVKAHRAVVKCGRRIADIVLKQRAVRQAIGEGLIVNSGGRGREESVVRARALFSDAAAAAPPPAGDAAGAQRAGSVRFGPAASAVAGGGRALDELLAEHEQLDSVLQLLMQVCVCVSACVCVCVCVSVRCQACASLATQDAPGHCQVQAVWFACVLLCSTGS